MLLFDDPEQARPTISRGRGVYLWDSSGKRYLDAVGGVHVVTIGHGVEAIADAAAKQARMVAFTSTRQFVTEASVRLADTIGALLPDPLKWVYFVSSGSEATEMAVQISHRYFTARREPNRTQIVGRWNSYHGGTVVGASIGGHRLHRERLAPYLLPFPHINTPHCARCPLGLRFPSCSLRCADELADVIEREGSDSVAAFMAEPIVGTTGGAITPPVGYYERIREICDEYGVLFIADEVVTGFGRTGLNFGFSHWRVTPDIVVCSKGMTSGYAPLGAVVVHARVIETLRAAGVSPGLRSTYSAHPVSCAIGLAVQEYVVKHDLVRRCARMGSYMMTLLKEMRDEVCPVTEVRGKGLLLGVELAVANSDRKPFARNLRVAENVANEARAAGLILLAGSGTPQSIAGDHLVISPPYIITEQECALVVEILKKSIGAVAERLGIT